MLCKMGITGTELPSPCHNMGRVQRHRAVPRVVSRRAWCPAKLQEGFEQSGKFLPWKLARLGLSLCRGSCGAGDEEGYLCPEHWQLVAVWLQADTWTHCMGWRWINSGWKKKQFFKREVDVEVQLKRVVVAGAGLCPGFAQHLCP